MSAEKRRLAPPKTMAAGSRNKFDYHFNKSSNRDAAAKRLVLLKTTSGREPKLVKVAQRPLWSVAHEGLLSFGKIA